MLPPLLLALHPKSSDRMIAKENAMNSIIYIVGLIVIVVFILSVLGIA